MSLLHLKGTATFGALNTNGPTTAFQIAATSGWLSYSNTIADHGTVTLSITGGSLGTSTVVAAQTNYGVGATPTIVAADLAGASSANSIVSLSANAGVLTITAVTPGAASNDIAYTLQNTSYDQTNFTAPSFPASTITGNLQNGVDASAGQTPQTVYSYSVPSGGYDGVGNLTSYSDSVMGSWSFKYDSLSRLIAGLPASGNSSNGGLNLCWSYDAFGNRTAQSAQPAACPTLPSVPTATASYNANNQVTWVANTAPNGFQYDASGNVLQDNQNTYLYDSEGRICAVKSQPVSGTYIMTGYVYDADGTRVAKGSITTLSCDFTANGFQTTKDVILGPSGEQMTEMNVDPSSHVITWAHSNVWAGGKLLATYDTTGLHFYLDDPLGTRRVQTNYAGVVEQNCSSLPFGDGETCGSTPTEHLFTGKERDTESGNDYFGARYYASSMGRFMSPDWASDPTAVPYASHTNPQTLNLYNYMRNNPMSGTDKDGHCGGPNDPCSKVTVTVTPSKQAVTVDTRTQTFTSADGSKQTVTTTGPSGDLKMVVKVNGTPTDGVSVKETNQNTVTTPYGTNSGDGKVEGTSVTQNGGTFPDTVGAGYTSEQLAAGKATTADAKDIFNSVPTTIVDKQTLTLGIPGVGGQPGCTCQATSTRTITNTHDGKTISPSGYTLTTTQPVVTNP